MKKCLEGSQTMTGICSCRERRGQLTSPPAYPHSAPCPPCFASWYFNTWMTEVTACLILKQLFFIYTQKELFLTSRAVSCGHKSPAAELERVSEPLQSRSELPRAFLAPLDMHTDSAALLASPHPHPTLITARDMQMCKC